MKVLFVNSREPRCGVHQYGRNLYYVMAVNADHSVSYATFSYESELRDQCSRVKYDVIIYNWQAGIGGWMGGAPFDGLKAKQVLAYHDLEANFAKFDAILFSDPTMQPHDNWHPIGRPVRGKLNFPPIQGSTICIGINGFIGAWASNVVAQAIKEYDRCHIRMHLPYAVYGDAGGDLARKSEQECRAMLPKGFTMEVNNYFLEWDELMHWLSGNHINCYLRNEHVNWRGVSSSLDAALCAGRPIAINRCNAFRHFFDCDPSVLINDRPLKDIVASGLAPLIKKHEEYSAERVSNQVFAVLEKLL